MIRLRDERPEDAKTISDLHLAAFGGSKAEPAIVEFARQRGELTWSIVAERDGEIVGHMMVSTMTLVPDPGLRCVAVGPIGVRPGDQGQGVGSALMHESIHRAQEAGYDAILLLGNPGYYRRFGFATAPVNNDYGADEAFMALQLEPGCLDKLGKAVTAKYIGAFADAEGL